MIILDFFKRGYCLKYEYLKMLIEIINQNSFQYFKQLHRENPFDIFKRNFVLISPNMQESILLCFEKLMSFYNEFTISNQNYVQIWMNILYRDINNYCQLFYLCFDNHNTMIRLTAHITNILTGILLFLL
jgi:hypothetical protein